MAPENCFPFFTISHTEEVVGTSHVKLGELAGLGKVLKRLIYQGQRAAVWDCDLVHVPDCATPSGFGSLF
jgi:hypothetical protein